MDDGDSWVLVGADQSSLEARMLAHYMAKFDGGTYGKLLLEGDVHTANRDALEFEQSKQGRDKAKTWYYAFLYGAGDEKLGASADPKLKGEAAKKYGAKLRAKFLKNTPALKKLVDEVKAQAKGNGFLLLPDGRRVYVRSEHSALNSLLQAAGAVICKHWIVNFNRRLVAELGPQGWRGQWAALLWIHDEVQLAVRKRHAELVKTILVEEARKLTTQFNWRVQLDGEAKVGMNWKETH